MLKRSVKYFTLTVYIIIIIKFNHPYQTCSGPMHYIHNNAHCVTHAQILRVWYIGTLNVYIQYIKISRLLNYINAIYSLHLKKRSFWTGGVVCASCDRRVSARAQDRCVAPLIWGNFRPQCITIHEVNIA